ncbi:hypothetical protein NESM_000876700 [Novymonas esmeraldas]|uniref:Uncharacterized protein n=1 Tax=Novymonas esmeraldas TaxID=1808958 RepID=A0AAW0F1L5_9TRYP
MPSHARTRGGEMDASAMAAAMTTYLAAQEVALQRLLEGCPAPVPGASLAPSVAETGTRASVIAELLRQERASQHALAAGQSAARETEVLRRAAALEEDRLALAEGRNAVLRRRLAALTQERREGARRPARGRDGADASLADGVRRASSSFDSGDWTNDVVEARRQLDQRTREVEESRERLRQLQHYHLGQLGGHLRPVMAADDAVRTTENFLDPETNTAVRATVVDALLEVEQALKPLATAPDGPRGLDSVCTLWDRLAVQDFVVGRINRLFTCMCPTAPPLTLLKDTHMM